MWFYVCSNDVNTYNEDNDHKCANNYPSNLDDRLARPYSFAIRRFLVFAYSDLVIKMCYTSEW